MKKEIFFTVIIWLVLKSLGNFTNMVSATYYIIWKGENQCSTLTWYSLRKFWYSIQWENMLCEKKRPNRTITSENCPYLYTSTYICEQIFTLYNKYIIGHEKSTTWYIWYNTACEERSLFVYMEIYISIRIFKNVIFCVLWLVICVSRMIYAFKINDLRSCLYAEFLNLE